MSAIFDFNKLFRPVKICGRTLFHVPVVRKYKCNTMWLPFQVGTSDNNEVDRVDGEGGRP